MPHLASPLVLLRAARMNVTQQQVDLLVFGERNVQISECGVVLTLNVTGAVVALVACVLVIMTVVSDAHMITQCRVEEPVTLVNVTPAQTAERVRMVPMQNAVSHVQIILAYNAPTTLTAMAMVVGHVINQPRAQHPTAA